MIEPNPQNDFIVGVLAIAFLLTIIPFLYYLAMLVYYAPESDELRLSAVKGSIAGSINNIIGVITAYAALLSVESFTEINYIWGLLGLIPGLGIPWGMYITKVGTKWLTDQLRDHL